MSLQSKDSVEKTLTQIGVVARKSFSHNGNQIIPPRKGVVVSNSFWRSYKCHLGCGGCCAAYTMDFLPGEFFVFKAKYPQHENQFRQRGIIVNGQSYFVYSANLDNKVSSRCVFLDQKTGSCRIHDYSPFSCSIELIKLKRIKGKGYIQKIPYGYAYRMKRITDGGPIQCEFCVFDEEQFRQDISMFNRLAMWADYFELDTRLDDLILALKTVMETKNYQPYISRISRLEFGTVSVKEKTE